MAKSHSLWVEKYRPDTLEEYIGNEVLKGKIDVFIKSQDIPHLLFVGPPGTGKTTMAKIITKHIDCDVKILNASDQNNIETVRTEIRSFAATSGFAPLKIMILDEFDGFTRQGQEALRNLMEQFSHTTRFILTANYLERVIEPIQSRSQKHHIEPPSKKDVAQHLAKILKLEGIEYSPMDVKALIDAHFPDIRKIIGEAQSSSLRDNTLVVTNEALIGASFGTQVVHILADTSKSAEDKYVEIRQGIADAKLRDFSGLYRILFDKVDVFAASHIPACILYINEGQYRDAFVVDKEINVIATICNILNTIHS